ncbi:MAG TPA: hypothetical protein VMU57_08905, partial [Edaphobacter sp.]|uniref:WD40/YVTN/BNR-like repeat-containing protein n=1 Tax=Edaphobacter sp. TaxID=1934404 RepID=UPI002C099342
PDKDGFWDALVTSKGSGLLIGDPVASRFEIYGSEDPGLNVWQRIGEESSMHTFHFDLSAYPGEELFAASNSVLMGSPQAGILFVGGGELGAKLSLAAWKDRSYISFKSAIPLAKGSTSGAFSFAAAQQSLTSFGHLVAVGGNYADPNQAKGTAAWSKDGGQHWHPSTTPSHGYRSSVAYDSQQKLWITVGPNGTDVSRDDGRNWTALKPTKEDAPDADKNWNALSLPFVVGPNGRIGKLRPSALNP